MSGLQALLYRRRRYAPPAFRLSVYAIDLSGQGDGQIRLCPIPTPNSSNLNFSLNPFAGSPWALCHHSSGFVYTCSVLSAPSLSFPSGSGYPYSDHPIDPPLSGLSSHRSGHHWLHYQPASPAFYPGDRCSAYWRPCDCHPPIPEPSLPSLSFPSFYRPHYSATWPASLFQNCSSNQQKENPF